MNRNVENRTCGHMRPAKIRISLRIRAVWSESSLGAILITKGTCKQGFFMHYEDSDQTARMRRLIWGFVERTCPQVPFLPLRLICTIYHTKWVLEVSICERRNYLGTWHVILWCIRVIPNEVLIFVAILKATVTILMEETLVDNFL